MKKLTRIVVSLLALITFGGTTTAAFTADTTPVQAAAKQTITTTYTLKQGKKTISKKTTKVAKNATVLTGLKKNWSVKQSKGFVTAIDGHKQNTKQKLYWTYTINGKMASKGVTQQKLQNNDKVVFNLSK
ncbi:hypothetical protein FC83_GL002030 [Agrilactobacillus composti DSM 18527 = JCM 14202]|uniref:Transcobalamin-like C-terminal domain-containing protein n=1 Tax=Agrilactobacillus composti DSM 18527 = JCM 14202 TaxID=1423734 RepID=X0PD80_9LACO|nr:DUF4430 domain-containing protein [Agrilactobacillus composti]KRM34890.1 hypothetical protein FC83_GL002030 [Agrilactobacillus composti DSM 18527 = JCM 14202]GAF38763.1 additional lipoprotein component of predicted cobalamin ECF transporter [Agrilactobacillus composti DSM 18527 = JCM 14202]